MARPRRSPLVEREAWLRRAAAKMAPWIKAASKATGVEAAYPRDTLVSVGWPLSRGKGNDAIGACYRALAHEDQRTKSIFISPELKDPVQVVDVLLHEMVHASLPDGVGHKKPFVQIIRELGLAGKPTATYAEKGSELHGKLTALAEALGPYPHIALSKQREGGGGKQSVWVRLYSPTIEGYSVVVSAKALEAHGAPLDPLGDEMEARA